MYPAYSLCNRRKTLTGSLDPTYMQSANKPCTHISGWVKLQFDSKCFTFSCFEMCWKHVEKVCWKCQHVLKTVTHIENYVEKVCWKFQHVLKTVMLCWKSMLKISVCVENCNACWKHVEKVCWKCQHMLKTVMHVENYLENFKMCWKHVEKFKASWKL